MGIFTRSPRDQARDTAAEAVETLEDGAQDVAETARDLADRAFEETSHVAAKAGSTAAHVGARLADSASRQFDRVVKDLHLEDRVKDLHLEDRVKDLHLEDRVKALKLEDRVDELVGRVRKEIPDDWRETVAARIEKELPDTDKDRYERAFQRGFARARSAYVFSGLAVGAAVGAAGALLLDPERGASRRAYLGQKFEGIRNDLAREGSGKAKWAADRARGIAMEKGLIAKPDDLSEKREPYTPPRAAGVHVWSQGDTTVHPDPTGGRSTEPQTATEAPADTKRTPADMERTPVAASAVGTAGAAHPAGSDTYQATTTYERETFEVPAEPARDDAPTVVTTEREQTTVGTDSLAADRTDPGETGTASQGVTDPKATTGDITSDPARVEPDEHQRHGQG
jgi:hypothetical protein